MRNDDNLLMLVTTLVIFAPIAISIGVSWLGLPPPLEVMFAIVATFIGTTIVFVKITGLDRPLYNK